jgi:hypothetical protein
MVPLGISWLIMSNTPVSTNVAHSEASPCMCRTVALQVSGKESQGLVTALGAECGPGSADRGSVVEIVGI